MFGLFKKKKIKVRINYGWYEVSEEGMHTLAKGYEKKLERNQVEYNNLRDRHSHNQGRIKTTRVYKEMDAEHKTKIKHLEDQVELLKNRIENLKTCVKECEE